MIIAVLLITVVLVGIGDRTGLPWPVLLTLSTAAIVFVPWIPDFRIAPDIILPIFLPPLLWALARKTSWSMFRARWRTILGFSVLLVAVTVIAVALTAWILVPGIAIAAAIALGAAVAPPDPVAVEAVAEPVGLPRRLTGLLQTEGLFNDAASLVIFQTALAATLGDEQFLFGPLVVHFFVSSAIAVALGLTVGWVGIALTRWLNSSVGRIALTMVLPFAVYLLAEELHASGVIAVVVASVHMASTPDIYDADDRITATSFWGVIDVLVTGLAFALIGLELRDVIDAAGTQLLTIAAWGVVISVVLIAVRALWMVMVWQMHRRKAPASSPRDIRDAVLLTWSGMRGLVTLALALSLPQTFAWRTEFLVIASVVLVVTMIVPGLTLPWLVRTLKLADTSEDEKERDMLVARARGAAVASLREALDKVPDGVKGDAREMLNQFSQARSGGVEGELASSADAPVESVRAWKRHRDALARVQSRAIEQAQREILDARSEPGVDPHLADSVIEELDRMMLSRNPRDH